MCAAGEGWNPVLELHQPSLFELWLGGPAFAVLQTAAAGWDDFQKNFGIHCPIA